MAKFAISDGFDNWQDFRRFFKEPFIGKLIIWKDCNFFENNLK